MNNPVKQAPVNGVAPASGQSGRPAPTPSHAPTFSKFVPAKDPRPAVAGVLLPTAVVDGARAPAPLPAQDQPAAPLIAPKAGDVPGKTS